MSKAQRLARLKEIIRELIKKNLAEVSTTATAGAANASGTGIYYDTPKAFASSASGSQGGHPKPDVVGYTKVKESVIKEYVSVDNFNKDFMTAMNLVIKQANNLKGPLGKHPIKRNVNKLKAVLSIYKKFVAPALVKADRDISKGFNLTDIKKKLADGQFKSVLQYFIMNRIGGRSYDSNEFYGVDDKTGKVLEKLHKELQKIVNVMDKANLESVNELSPQAKKIEKQGAKTLEKAIELHIKIVKKNPTSKNEKDLANLIKYYVQGSTGRDEGKIYYKKKYPKYFNYSTMRFKKDAFKHRLESINEGRYHDWRNDESMTPKQKVGRSMREIRDALNELDKTVKMNLKLKTELNMKSEDYWKNTHKALTKISERLVKMANKVGNLK